MKKVYFGFFIVGAILAIVLSRFLSPNPLSDVTIDNLELNNRQFIFEKDGIRSADSQKVTSQEEQQIKRLVYFYLLTTEDPLFTSPDFDTTGLSEVIAQLKEVEEKFAADFPDYPHLFPINFLSSIPDVKNAEKVFLQKPSDVAAQSLISAYQQAAAKYQQDSSNFINTVNNHQEEIPNSKVVFLGSATSKSVLLSDLKLLEKNAIAIKDEIEKRERCLTSGTDCYRPASSFTKPAKTQTPKSTVKLLDLNLLFLGLDDGQKQSIKGPYFASGGCFGEASEYPFYVYTNQHQRIESQENSYLEIKLASDNYFRKAARDTFDRNFPIGYERVWQRETRNYLCPDLSYQAKAATLDYFLQNYQQKPLLSKNPAKNIEAGLLNSPQPSYLQAEQLSSWYAYLYLKSADPTLKKELLTRYLVVNRRLSSLPELLGKSVYEWLGILLLDNHYDFINKNDGLMASFYLPRSAWSFMYLTFSPSVWRLEEQLKFTENTQITDEHNTLPYWNYQQMKSYYGGEDIKKIQELSVENARNY